MKNIFAILVLNILLMSCSNATDEPNPSTRDYKQEMRNFVENISNYCQQTDPEFIVIPQNGHELVTKSGTEDGEPDEIYLSAIDGAGQEDLFFGYEGDNQPTPESTRNYLTSFLNICLQNDVTVLVTDYCSSTDNIAYSYNQNYASGYVSFAASERDLNVIPPYPPVPNHVSFINVDQLSDARNFLYLINPENYASKADFINAVAATDFDLIIMDMFFNDEEFTSDEINSLKHKANGSRRLVVSYMSIGEAENYRYYWQNDWNDNKPDWLAAENPNWEGNYKVHYWDPNWQQIIFGNDDSYAKKILDAGFDGVYLDIIDAFDYYE